MSESDALDGQPGGAPVLIGLLTNALPVTFPLTEPVNYEPTFDESVFMTALAAGVDVQEHMYDLLLAEELVDALPAHVGPVQRAT